MKSERAVLAKVKELHLLLHANGFDPDFNIDDSIKVMQEEGGWEEMILPVIQDLQLLIINLMSCIGDTPEKDVVRDNCLDSMEIILALAKRQV